MDFNMKIKKYSHILQIVGLGFIFLIIIFFGPSCAKKRPVKEILPEVQRLEKNFFTDGEFYYKVTVVGASADTGITHLGDSSGTSASAKFEFSENNLTLYAIDPRYKDDHSLAEPVLVFPLEKHVDVEREKNGDDEETHREIETQMERPWNERKYAKINFARLKLIPVDFIQFKIFENFNSVTEVSSDLLDLNQDGESLNLVVQKTFRKEDSLAQDIEEETGKTFTLKLKVSFLKRKENKNFKPTLYTERLREYVGIFSTKIKSNDKYNKPEEKRYALHWDPNKKIKYTLSRNFPEKYKFLVRKVIAQWNEVLKDMKIAGKPLIELQENHGEELGDLKHNFIVWIEDPIFKGPLGLGPSYADGLTGEIINADSYIFAGNIKHTVLYILEKRERVNLAQSQTRPDENNTNNHGANPGANNAQPQIASDSGKSISELIDEESKAPTFKKIFEDIKKPQTLENALYHYKNLSDRCYYPPLEETPAGSAPAVPWFLKKTEEELFQEILLNTLAHEMGHNLGLAHNFKGSLDKKHYISEKIQTSSTMDYLAIEDSEEGTPGPYDKAALAYAFSGDFDFNENYLFCSDQSVPIDPLCNQWDRGDSAEKIAEYLVKRYHDGYIRRNFRGKKIHFKDTPETRREYQRNLVNYYFMPLREFLDYHIYVGTKSKTLTDEPFKENEWKTLLEDLEKAAAIGFDFFTQIVLDKDRIYKDIIHPKFPGEDELLARGTWIDKLLAADALSSRDLGVDPWSTLRTTYFDLPLYQNKLFEFFHTVVTDISTPNAIIFSAAQKFMNNVPSGDSVATAFAVPSEDATEFFNINELELSDDQIMRLLSLNANEPHAFLIDHEKGKIFSARKTAVLAYPTTPTYTLIEAHNKIFHKLTPLSLKELKKAILMVSKLKDDLSDLNEDHIMALRPFIHPAVIVITKEGNHTVIPLLDEDEEDNVIEKINSLNSLIEKLNKELPAKGMLGSLREYLNELNAILSGTSFYDSKIKLMEKLKEKEKELDPTNPESNIILRLNMVKRFLNAYRKRIEMMHYLYNNRSIHLN